jgi:hypothetical protein
MNEKNVNEKNDEINDDAISDVDVDWDKWFAQICFKTWNVILNMQSSYWSFFVVLFKKCNFHIDMN